MNVVWTMGGFDPSGAAGLVVDAKVLASLGVHGVCVVTALTAQSLERCVSVTPLSPEEISKQIDSLGHELRPQAIKIGLLPTVAAVRAVLQVLAMLRDGAGARPLVVFDPVLAPSSGVPFVDAATAAALVTELIPAVDLITPNLPEAQRLLGQSIGAAEAAQGLLGRGARAVLVKGGHAAGDGPVADFFATNAGHAWILGERLGWEARGTGCALATAIAAFAARGEDLADAVVAARAYVASGIRAAHDLGASRRVLEAAPWPDHRGPGQGPWPSRIRDLPWIGATGMREAPTPFPDCGAEPLGFYPIVESAAWVRRLVPLGVRTIQIRIKDKQGTALMRELEEARRICEATGARLFVNDHWREAIEVGAYGVHLGQEDLPGADVDALRNRGMRLGVSTHSYAEAARAHGVRPSYVALGPIFPTTLKSMRFAPQGNARIAEWRALFACPLVAIGGITLERAGAALRAGADAIAAVSDVSKNPDPEGRTRAWLAFFESAGRPGNKAGGREAHG